MHIYGHQGLLDDKDGRVARRLFTLAMAGS